MRSWCFAITWTKSWINRRIAGHFRSNGTRYSNHQILCWSLFWRVEWTGWFVLWRNIQIIFWRCVITVLYLRGTTCELYATFILFLSMFNGLRPVRGGLYSHNQSGHVPTGSLNHVSRRLDVLFVRARVHCGNKSRQTCVKLDQWMLIFLTTNKQYPLQSSWANIKVFKCTKTIILE